MSKYNGYTNWETWNVMLWVSNDEALYRETTRFVNAKIGTVGFVRKVKAFCMSMFPTGTPDMDTVREMKTVNWIEISSHIKEWND